MNANDNGALQLVLFRGKQGFVEVPELGFEIDMNNILSGILSLST